VAGETDLGVMLASVSVDRRDGAYVFVTSDDPDLLARAAATVHEVEGVTVIVSADVAGAAGLQVDGTYAWLTLTVFSSLEAVGLTAAVSGALADAGIPCNVLAGRHHDHLLVPEDCAQDAIDAVEALRVASSR
jgi:hypothetical protein